MKKRILITGGAGFIGVNAAAAYLQKGWNVGVLDNLSRKGTDKNLRWLKRQGPVDFVKGDLRDPKATDRWLGRRRSGLEIVMHFAAQVAVTTSVTDPRSDFEMNAFASFNLLEAVRKSGKKPFTLYASTNKVYGGMESVKVRRKGDRYIYVNRPRGITEADPLDFHSPYGCSKGAADQYFRDYHRIYGIPTVVFRQSCIYGPHQQGNEDQGWVAHFMKAAQANRGITLFGDGRQVRDVLYVGDLLKAYETAYRKRGISAGRIYNMGGGPANTVSLLELLAWISQRRGKKISVKKKGWRPGDQRVFISSVDKIRRELGWKPETRAGTGFEKLWTFLESR
ncbi:MAG: CDP-paratose 2-epimerase [Elusimicrobia bacterium]|nr:MAG: CDP-paratose 2-epimerase [Elusimicrobiota bacterium]